MVPILNIRGYTASDPLDRAQSKAFVFTICASGVLAAAVLYLESFALHVVAYKTDVVFWVGWVIFTFGVGSLLAALRKSSSILFFLIIVIPGVLADIWLETHLRMEGSAWWTYKPDAFLAAIQVPWRFFVAWSIDGIALGPLALWLARLAAAIFYPAGKYMPEPTTAQSAALFPAEWAIESPEPAARDAGFWILRLLGLGYLAYMVFCAVGALGASVWPEQARTLIVMTYQNPALAINTFSKISLMVVLAFIGAYNRNVRFYSTVGLFAGHLASTMASIGFYFYDPPGAFPALSPATLAMPTYRSFLLTSAAVDGVMVLIFAWILIKYRSDARMFAPRKEFSDYPSLPGVLSKWYFYCFAALMALLIPAFLLLRLFGGGQTGLAAVFGYPDPQLGNTITMLATMCVIALLVARGERLREYLTAVLVLGLMITVIGEALYAPLTAVLGANRIYLRNGATTTVDWYFIGAALVDALLLTAMLGIRKLFYNVDYAVSSLNPTSAQDVIAQHDAFYEEDPVASAAVLQKIDRYVGDIHGRKRGLLNFPFWIFEQLLSPIYCLHPTFSSMSPDEGRHFLRKYILRPPVERNRSFIPALAELSYKLGIATNAFITFAHYTQMTGWEETGYIPPDARDRLQGDYPSSPPPLGGPAVLPDSPASSANNKPDFRPPRPLIAPRVSTPISQPDIPDSVDYLIIGSGAGGACMAYRLASAVPNPAGILVVDRGPRYSPLQDFNDDEMDMYCKLYKEGGLQQSKRFDLMVLQGECVGGTTVINNAVCLPMPVQIRQLWQQEYGLDLDALGAYNSRGWPSAPGEYADVAADIEISEIPEAAINQKVKQRFFAAVDKYNHQHKRPGGPPLTKETLSANQRNMVGDGLCNLGNKRLRKRTMLETYLPWAEARGVKIIPQTGAVCFQAEPGARRANAVVLRTAHGVLKTVKVNKAVIVAAGVIASSQFLMTSGVKKNVGLGMSCNFAFPVAFQFPDILDSFDGTQITLAAIDNQPDQSLPPRAAFETYSNPPGAFATSIPFYFNRARDLMKHYRYLVNFGALVGSEANGVISLTGDPISGRPFTWRIGDQDRRNIKFALTTLAELGLAAGAQRIVLPTEPGLDIPLTAANVERFKKALTDYPLDMSDLRLTTAHPQGGNRMMGDKSPHRDQRAVDGSFRVDGFDNVFVADASVFPTGITVNPQWTIMALSSMAAKKVLEVN